MNSQISFHARPVLAGLLLTLLASVALAEGNSLKVQGAIEGHAVGAPQGGTLQAAGGGSGVASNIGRFTFTLQATVDPAGNSIGLFVLVFSNGDIIHGSLSGQGRPTESPTVARIDENLAISGGTGRFQGATGTLTFNRLVDLSTLPAYDSSSGTVMGTIGTPVPSK